MPPVTSTEIDPSAVVSSDAFITVGVMTMSSGSDMVIDLVIVHPVAASVTETV